MALAFFMLDAPILAVAALFGKAKAALLPTVLLTFLAALILGLFIPPIT